MLKVTDPLRICPGSCNETYVSCFFHEMINVRTTKYIIIYMITSQLWHCTNIPKTNQGLGRHCQ